MEPHCAWRTNARCTLMACMVGAWGSYLVRGVRVPRYLVDLTSGWLSVRRRPFFRTCIVVVGWTSSADGRAAGCRPRIHRRRRRDPDIAYVARATAQTRTGAFAGVRVRDDRDAARLRAGRTRPRRRGIRAHLPDRRTVRLAAGELLELHPLADLVPVRLHRRRLHVGRDGARLLRPDARRLRRVRPA